ncbi:hypothetical protein A2W45_02580 [Candidatus Curtissbacteria bacterium RIFCSPHIGHO2_12_41_11]|uniref:PD-(D/E)XK endonuclease-like domain-containing protein n=2 Tax=Candidatus Curtissiibacteriota TaxID=1752717 RepID=A0A1F5H407_9BACT|nr:MAG: hypothetical protein A3D07_02795 [Candidatus Curtissbacteria bacterium RIFCSPHIGHO2_02_FULL_42_15]OGD98774.1 MAG: hypothetical protein A2W45_02580 [Candidatus Curtissbacteria bacterium RIFCSPHIGHO2_12_41_11]
MSKDGKIWLSHTGIEGLERCPRCFWLYYRKGIRQPEGIVSRLANRFDIVLKNYFDSFRPQLPPMVEGKLKGKLQNPFREKYFVTIDEKYGFWGKLDECLVDGSGELVPVDFKTSSSDPREKEILQAYVSQIDAYIFLLKQNKQKTADCGYLIFVFPDHSQKLHEGFPMVIHVQKVLGDGKKTAQKIAGAIEILEGKIPDASEDCVFCKYRSTVNELESPKQTSLFGH